MELTRQQYNLLAFIIIIFALEAILFSAGNFKSNLVFLKEEQRIEKIKNILDNTSILAKAVSVYDISQNKKIYGKNDNIAIPLASLAKTMTIAVALDSHNNKDIISITSDSVKQMGDFGLLPFENWNILDLAKFTLIVSANDGAYALAQNDNNFLEKMNSKARKLGMANTLFLNFTGLDIDLEKPGALASAEDANTMAIYALKSRPEIFSITTLPEINLKSLSGIVHNIKNTDIILDKIPNLLFSKTGYTELAGGNLTVIFINKKSHIITITVLGSTFLGRFSDMENLVNVLYNL